MYNIWARINNIFAFTTSVLAVATFAAFLSSYLQVHTATAVISADNVRVKSVPYDANGGAMSDYAHMNLNIEADLTPLFNWNVKELFVYLVANYKTKKNAVNQVVLWDQVVLRNDRVVINEKALNPKYYFIDEGRHLLSHPNVTLTLNWETIPNSGFMFHSRAKGSHRVELPSKYTTGRF
uniref:Signal peptidase complex subunit 3 n=1 Tax=Rhabditophanes sp. KR3021 TaxID=114890 RepID=A0AC35TZX8_9BILA